MQLPSRVEIEQAARVVYQFMSPTPAISWPLLNERLGTELWLKHENHAPTGSFKVRGGLVYFRSLRESGDAVPMVATATRGNFGQAVALAARREGIAAMVFVPRGNSPSKNRAMRAFGATLVEYGEDFEEARREAARRAADEGWRYVPSFHQELVRGVATYGMELLSRTPAIDTVYVPIGLGSGICGMIAAREALGLNTEIVGVVSDRARAYYESFAARRPVEAPVTTRIADGLACRAVAPEALEIVLRSAARIVKVTDDEVEAAMRAVFDDAHNVAEGAGAAAVAGALQEAERCRGRRVAAVLTGGNVDRALFRTALAEPGEVMDRETVIRTG